MRLLLIAAIAIALTSCKKMSDGPTTVLTEKTDTAAVSLKAGSFQNGPYGMVTGTGSIFRNTDSSYAIVLENFSSSNGPDLYVYLSKQPMPVDFIEAGKLRSTMGRQVYTLPGQPDLNSFKYISIHCKAFNHLFGYATLP